MVEQFDLQPYHSGSRDYRLVGLAALAAVATYALPLKLNILVAIAAAVLAGLAVETWQRRQRTRQQVAGQVMGSTFEADKVTASALVPPAPANVQPAQRQP